jgi:hypothetical protein
MTLNPGFPVSQSYSANHDSPGGNVIKHFYIRNLRMVIISYSVRPQQSYLD